MIQFYRDPADIATYLDKWIKERLGEAGAKGGVVGLSGGVDSAVVAALLRRACGRDGALAVIMPCHSDPVDEKYALLLADALDIRAEKLDLSLIYDEMTSLMDAALGETSDAAKSNVKPRLRMIALYAAAQTRNFLVFGGTNRDEMTFGYFTKYGDAGVDAFPLGDLLKGEVFALAEYLGVPGEIIDRPPTAGLWEGQTDEMEMGVSYAEFDRFLATGEADEDVAAKINRASKRTEHKRLTPPIAVLPAVMAASRTSEISKK